MSDINEMNLGPQWYIIHTYSGYESKVKLSIEQIVKNRGLGHLIFDVVVLTEKGIVTNSKGEQKEVESKLMPTYVLINMVMNDESWHIIRNTTGVTGFVGPGSAPVALTDEEVEKLGVEVKVVEVKFAVGDSVQICDGPLAGFIGIVNEISPDMKKVTVTASMFGRETKVELDSTQVKTLDE